MANCGSCGKSLGCACNLINGLCPGCFSKNINNNSSEIVQKKRKERIVYNNPKPAVANTEFNEILKTTGMTREEKLKRINDILEKAKQ